jgi:hypothetical protein
LKKVLVVVIGILIAGTITGCSNAQEFSGGTAENGSVPSNLTETELKATMVDVLRGDCSSLNSYVLSPSNWETVFFDVDTGGEFSLPGDGGTLTLDVVSNGNGGANVTIADSDYESTNSALYYSGCATLATTPAGNDGSNLEGTDGSSTDGQVSGHYEQKCTYNQVPNPQWDPNAAPGVMSMKGIPQYINQQSCQQVWVNQ